MTVIEDLKNFIRHGKHARPTEHSSPATATAIVKAAPSTTVGDKKQPDVQEVLQKIVAEEKEARGRMPSYSGLEKYRLIEKMGDGAFSNVYKAQNSETKQMVAIKVVRKYELTATQRANILKEVQIMRTLNHPNVVGLLEFQESRDYYYLVLELMEGGELFHQIIRYTYFSEDLSRHIIIQVAHAVRYLHEEKGVVHRDIKPENLLFQPIPVRPSKHPRPKQPGDEDKVDEGDFLPGVGAGGIGCIKIADFGLSKIVWDAQTMTPCGTVGYTAPEIVKDERYSKSVDMWALGCVLYTLLCGFPPFYDERIETLTQKVARGQYTFLSPWWDDISKSAKDLISHLLTVDPGKRFTIDEFLAHPWIRQTQEATTAAFDAPPLFTPVVTALSARGTPLTIETPGRDFRSPGLVSLREAFDVPYAVHRMEEEGARRKNVKRGHLRNVALNPPDEDDKEQVSNSSFLRKIEKRMSNVALSEKKRLKDPTPQNRRQSSEFELTLENSTLLGRRKGVAAGGDD